MLRAELSPSDPVLLFAAVDGKFYEARLGFTTNPKRAEARAQSEEEKRGGGCIHKKDFDRT